MEIRKENNFKIKRRTIAFEEDSKLFEVSYVEKMGLYFILFSKEDKTFEITKEDEYIYKCFSDLYEKIKNNKLYEVDEYELENAKTDEEKEYIYEQNEEMNNYQKENSNYDKMFDGEKITIVTDDKINQRGNDYEKVSISKTEDKIVLEFNYNIASVKMNAYESFYKPYNMLFVEAFNNLMKYDKEKEITKGKVRVKK